jgi:hypothetical protein
VPTYFATAKALHYRLTARCAIEVGSGSSAGIACTRSACLLYPRIAVEVVALGWLSPRRAIVGHSSVSHGISSPCYSSGREAPVLLRQQSTGAAVPSYSVFTARPSASTKHWRSCGSGAVRTSAHASRRCAPMRSNGFWDFKNRGVSLFEAGMVQGQLVRRIGISAIRRGVRRNAALAKRIRLSTRSERMYQI